MTEVSSVHRSTAGAAPVLELREDQSRKPWGGLVFSISRVLALRRLFFVAYHKPPNVNRIYKGELVN